MDSPASGKPAPQIDLVRLTSGSDFDHLNQLSLGDVTLVHFWGTWCGPCKMEYPHLADMVDRLNGESSFRFVSVSCEYGAEETFESLRHKTSEYFAAESIQGIAYCDPRSVTRRSVAQRLGRNAMYYPTSVLIGKDGRIAAVWEGYSESSVSEIESAVHRLLKQPPQDRPL
ncbi:MAG: TlpA family protein disulfide reductase [Rubripirellula sp.]